MKQHPIPLQVISQERVRGQSKKNRIQAKQCMRETQLSTYALMLSTPSYISCCCTASTVITLLPKVKFIPLFQPTSVYLIPALQLLPPSTPYVPYVRIHSLRVSKPSQYSLIHSTCQLPFYCSFTTHLFIPNYPFMTLPSNISNASSQ